MNHTDTPLSPKELYARRRLAQNLSTVEQRLADKQGLPQEATTVTSAKKQLQRAKSESDQPPTTTSESDQGQEVNTIPVEVIAQVHMREMQSQMQSMMKMHRQKEARLHEELASAQAQQMELQDANTKLGGRAVNASTTSIGIRLR